MAVSPEYRDFVLEQLGRVTPVTHRAMFGGVGVYAEGLFFALMDDDMLYFKTDAQSRAAYEAAGMEPFRPYGPDAAPMAYHQLPGDLLETPEALRPWVDAALAVARAARRGR